MARQTQRMVKAMEEQPKTRSSSVQKVIADIIDLFELQMELISVDSQEAKRKLVKAGIYVGIAVPLAGSALTVLLAGCGLLLGEMTSLSIGGSMLVMGVVFFAIVGVLLFLALQGLKAAASAMSETKSEFSENLRWLKATLVSPSTSPRNQIRRESFPDPHRQGYAEPAYQSTRRNGSAEFVQ